MKRVLLIWPKFRDENSEILYPPLGVLYLSSYLTENNIENEVLDCQINGDINFIGKKVKEFSPDMVCISMMTCQLCSGIKIANMIKRFFPSIIVCGGGPHVSSTFGELFDYVSCFDYLFYGPSEKPLLDLVNGKKPENIGNLIMLKAGEVLINRKNEDIPLDKLPFPDFGKIKLKDYKMPFINSGIFIPMITSTGCPYGCKMCSVKICFGDRVKYRSANCVVDEIRLNRKKFSVEYISFFDSAFTMNRKHALAVCDAIKESGLNVKWRCTTRVDKVDAELLHRMKHAGCDMISFGIESGNQNTLNYLSKRITLDMIRKAVELCQKSKIRVQGFFLFGFPDENIKESKNTIRFAKELDLDYVEFSKVIPFPGTELYMDCKSRGLLKKKVHRLKDSLYFTYQINHPSIANRDLDALVKKAYSKVYLSPKFIKRNFMDAFSKKNLDKRFKLMSRFKFN